VGCWTGYLLNDEDGSCRFGWAKWGHWLITDDDVLAAAVAHVRRTGILVTDAASGSFGDGYCQGVAIDLLTRRYRCFPCVPSVSTLEVADLKVRGAAVWDGWDACPARGGREELAEVVPAGRHVIAPYRLRVEPMAQLALDNRDEWFVRWDPSRSELVVRDDPASADWYGQNCGLVSVVTADLRLLDYRVVSQWSSTDRLLPWFTHGATLVDALLAHVPFPPAMESLVDAGALIDLDRRTLGYWSGRFIPDRLLVSVAAAWPGWRVKRLPHGLAGQLAATGRRRTDLLDDAPSANGTGGSDSAWRAKWDARRYALPLDPRPLRPARIRVS